MFTVFVTHKNGRQESFEHFDSYDRARNFADNLIAEDEVMRAIPVAE